MTTSQVQTIFLSTSTFNNLNFSFLSQVPSSKRRVIPEQQLPPPKTSLPPPPPPKTPFANILAWASKVQPGSPAPISPPLSRLLEIQNTPTTAATIEFDLTNLGYNSLFVHLPKTPTTPSQYLRPKRSHNNSGATPKLAQKPEPYSHIPIPPIPTEDQKPKRKLGMKRIRSLTLLRLGKSSSSSQTPPSPTKTSKSVKVTSTTPATAGRPRSQSQSQASHQVASTIAKRKRAKYPNVRPPPTLANELALMQFAEGGSMDANIKRVMDAQAKQAAGYASGGSAAVGVATVYRDENGGVWWDADEELEYAHLLNGAATDQNIILDNWVDFAVNFDKENPVPITEERRSSLISVDSELNPTNLIPLPENEPTSGPNALVNDRALISKNIGGPGMSVLALPCRPNREAVHLRRPTFLVDKTAFAAFLPRSPVDLAFDAAKTNSKPRGKARRRPAPLTLTASAHNTTKLVVATNSNHIVDPERAKKEFLDTSFKPLPITPAHHSPVVHVHIAPQKSHAPTKITSKLNMLSLFSRRTD